MEEEIQEEFENNNDEEVNSLKGTLEDLTEEQIIAIKEQIEQEETNDGVFLDEDDLAKLVFRIKKDGNIDVEFRWDDKDESYSTILGAFLYEVNSGSYTDGIIGVLSNHIQNYPEDIVFVSNIISTWKAGNQSDSKKEAWVQPLRTFGQSRFMQG